MKRERTYEELLSAYIDEALQEEDVRFVEETLLNDPVWRKRYEDMRSLRSRMRSLAGSDRERDALWPAISQKLQEEGKKREKIEVIPARLVPVMTVLVMLFVGLGSFLITRNWDTVTGYFDEARTMVTDISEQGIVRGALQPLFEGVTNDDLMRFALSGILEIPEGDGQGLKVESEGEDQFGLEFADARKAREAPSLNELYAELDVTADQQQSIDSVLTDYKGIVRASVFLADDEEVVISPELAGLDKFIIASVAEHLEPAQRMKFNEVLNRFNPELHVPRSGPFAYVASHADAFAPQVEVRIQRSPDIAPFVQTEVRVGEEKAEQTGETKKPKPRTFIVIRPDTVVTKEYEIPDYDRFAARQVDAGEIQRTVGETIAKAMQNTRIQIQPHVDVRHDGHRVQITTRVDRADTPGETAPRMIHLDSLMMDQLRGEHFVRLRELSKLMQQRTDFIQQQIPQLVGQDTIRIPQHFNPFEESFEQNMRQLEFDLERLGEELEKILQDPEKLMLMRDTVYFHLFPDTLERE